MNQARTFIYTGGPVLVKTGDACPTVITYIIEAYAIRPYVLFPSSFYFFLFSLRNTRYEMLSANLHLLPAPIR